MHEITTTSKTPKGRGLTQRRCSAKTINRMSDSTFDLVGEKRM